MVGEELQKAIYDRASQELAPFATRLVSPTPSPAPSPASSPALSPTPSPTPSPSRSPIADMTHRSQPTHSPQENNGNNAMPYAPSSPITQPTQGVSKEPVWPESQVQSPRPHRVLVKGSVANVLRRYSVAEEATRRFRSLEVLGSENPVFELDIAYELQTKLRALIRQLEGEVFGRGDGQQALLRGWY
ncbi:hypothetical protein FRC08_015871 [Ceratobasidium sp. 394]|nr:hypothetical protein FRC08_015871 [Ceratobasidium sp. 394]